MRDGDHRHQRIGPGFHLGLLRNLLGMAKTAEIICEYLPYIEHAPMAPQALYSQACSSDQITVVSWKDTWLKNYRANHAKHGPFKDRGIGKLFGRYRNLPALVLGSGPSLKDNATSLAAGTAGVPVISCLHNFHFLEDSGVKVDLYVTLDAGPLTIEEVSEGGQRTAEEYWALTKDRTLLAYVATDPRLLELWQGEVYFFNCPLPDQKILEEMDAVEVFHTYVSTGGNVLGASMYIAKAILGCNPIALMGANFCFSYLDKFHGWDSKYDKHLGNYIRTTDVYGHSVKTWQSYANFKAWFDWVAETIPGLWINCTEGGTWGAYAHGNIRSVRQMEVKDFIRMYSLCEEIREQCENPETDVRKILF